jgi:nucleoid-associated protein YgaU
MFRRRAFWLVIVLLILAAALGLVVGQGIIVSGRSLGRALAPDSAARPTFVVAVPVTPTPTGQPRPTLTPSATTNDSYTVEPGDTLRSIAQQVYGDAAQWPRIYDANRETIGPNPDALSAGTQLRIPRP